MRPFSQICVEYLASGLPAHTMPNDELAELIRGAALPSGAFTALLDANDAVGGRRVRDRSRKDRDIFQTIGVPTHMQFAKDLRDFVPFFDFGVAAPCDVGLNSAGSVVADFGGDLQAIEAAECIEVFLEGQAREMLAAVKFDHSTGASVDRTADEVLAALPSLNRVAEASDRWTTWWQSDRYLARLSTVWDRSRSVQLVLWSDGVVPEGFAPFLTK